MKLKYIFLFLLILIVTYVNLSVGIKNSVNDIITDNFSDEVVSHPESILIPVSLNYTKPINVPNLRSYDIDKSNDIWHAKDPSSYITPDNEWVRYYASQYEKYIDGKESDYPQIEYIQDYEDYWQNADYTLYIGKGDCEDAAIAWASIYRSLNHKTIIVAGYLWFNDGTPNIRDFWCEWIDEYGVKNTKFMTPVVREKEYKAIPKYMFNDEISWRSYNANWYF